MKSYFIFAIVLTAAYIVYYAVIIVHDLYGKKGTGKMQEEVFDLGEPDDEESVAVTENETGFEVGATHTKRKPQTRIGPQYRRPRQPAQVFPHRRNSNG